MAIDLLSIQVNLGIVVVVKFEEEFIGTEVFERESAAHPDILTSPQGASARTIVGKRRCSFFQDWSSNSFSDQLCGRLCFGKSHLICLLVGGRQELTYRPFRGAHKTIYCTHPH